MNLDGATHKIKKHNNKFVIFYSDNCPFCDNALKLLHDYNYKKYNIEVIGGLQKLLSVLKKTKKLTGFKETHSTKPIIFYKGKFIGGYTELEKFLHKKK